jgi:hypothetical protein
MAIYRHQLTKIRSRTSRGLLRFICVTKSFNARPQTRRRFACLSLLPVGIAVLTLTGCAPKRMRSDFIGFEKAYAETSNREVLLNLARLENHDTTYFFKLGQISSSYRMQASLSGSGSYVIQGTGAGGNATGGGIPGLIFENDPSFTFIPVNDDTNAQLLLKPVPAETLYNLYLQGWRVDQLFRLMVDRIELTIPSPNGQGCIFRTYHNQPPPNTTTRDTNNSYLRDASSYATFLRVSALVYGLQKHGYLKLRGTTTFIPFDTSSGIPVSPEQPNAPRNGEPTRDTTAPKASDFAAAAAKSQSWRLIDNKWILGQQIYGAEFYLAIPPIQATPDAGKKDPFGSIRSEVFNDEELHELQEGEGPDQALRILASGFSIEEPPSQGATIDTNCAPAKGPAAHLVLRSLIGLMAAAAQEQNSFESLLGNTNPLPPSNTQDVTNLSFKQAVPKIEQIPALRLQWTAGDRSGPDLVQVNYRGKTYLIADSNNSTLAPENLYWNRDMFRLIAQLTSQVTVDISKFPLPGILQLHTN